MLVLLSGGPLLSNGAGRHYFIHTFRGCAAQPNTRPRGLRRGERKTWRPPLTRYSAMPDPIVAYVEFTDGLRPVFEGSAGQYVFDDDGQKIRGVWYIPREECDVPVIVEEKR